MCDVGGGGDVLEDVREDVAPRRGGVNINV